MDRPQIKEYLEPSTYVRDMLTYRKYTEEKFSVNQGTRKLRKVSPTLVSLVIQKKRQITLDRVDEFAKLLSLTSGEKTVFKNWIGQLEGKTFAAPTGHLSDQRKTVGTSILDDWLNVYVKDFFQIHQVQKNPQIIEKQLMGVASPDRINKSIRFLMREGHLRRTLEGNTVLDTPLSIAETPIPSKKIRQFHKGALGLAKMGIDLFSSQERFANTLIIPLDESRYQELTELVHDFGERLKEFAEKNPDTANRLYQLVINLSPIGGKIE
jgi:uncharacterized protein (TIGR02147 family)